MFNNTLLVIFIKKLLQIRGTFCFMLDMLLLFSFMRTYLNLYLRICIASFYCLAEGGIFS